MILLCSVAAAHVGATITGVDVEPHPSGPQVLLEANFGLLWSEDGATFHWTCHETVTAEGAIITPRYARGPDGTLLVTITAMEGRNPEHSLYRSDDGGCTWSTAGLPGELVSALDWSGSSPLLGTGSVDASADNDLYRSDDGGQTWLAADLGLGSRVVLSVLGDEDRAWATVADTTTGEGWLLVSEGPDSEWMWTSLELDSVSEDPLQRLVLVAAADETVWLIAGFLNQDTLLRVGQGEVQTVYEVDGDLIDGAVTDDGWFWVVEGSRRVHTSEDGTQFSPDESLPVSIGVGADESPWLTTYADFTGALLFRGAEPVLRPADIAGPLECPADSESATVCDPLWPDLEARLAVFAPSDTDAPTDSGADEGGPVVQPEPRFGCGLVPLRAWWLAFLAAALIRRP